MTHTNTTFVDSYIVDKTMTHFQRSLDKLIATLDDKQFYQQTVIETSDVGPTGVRLPKRYELITRDYNIIVVEPFGENKLVVASLIPRPEGFGRDEKIRKAFRESLDQLYGTNAVNQLPEETGRLFATGNEDTFMHLRIMGYNFHLGDYTGMKFDEDCSNRVSDFEKPVVRDS